MKKTLALIFLTGFFSAAPAIAGDMDAHMGMDHHMMMNNSRMTAMKGAKDTRVSLGLSASMRRTQLAMMRDHLKSVDEIVAFIAAGKFDKASKTAHQRLGLTPEMKKMCSMFGNDAFRTMGIAFHKSADHLAEVLKTRDTTASLHALHSTMQYCVSCHQSFRQ